MYHTYLEKNYEKLAEEIENYDRWLDKLISLAFEMNIRPDFVYTDDNYSKASKLLSHVIEIRNNYCSKDMKDLVEYNINKVIELDDILECVSNKKTNELVDSLIDELIEDTEKNKT